MYVMCYPLSPFNIAFSKGYWDNGVIVIFAGYACINVCVCVNL